MAGKRLNGEHSIYLSGGRWHVQGWIGFKRVRVSATKRADALSKWQQRVAAHALSGEPQPSILDARALSTATVTQVLEQWFAMNEHKWSYSTRRGYRHDIDRKIGPHIGEVPISELDVAQVEAWQHNLLAGGCAPSSVRQARIVLGQAVDMMVRYGRLPANRVALAKGLPKSKVAPDHLTEEEARRVLAAATDPGARARWLLALTLGLRSGEVLALRWDDLELDHVQPRLRVTGSLQFQTGRGLVRVPPKTTHSRRTLILSQPHVSALRAVRAEQAKLKLKSDHAFNPGNYVFTTVRGTPVDPSNDRKNWFALLDAAGVRRVRRHDARHTAATLLLSAGAGIASVQKVLGHANISTTVDTYGHLTAEDGAAFTARLTDSMLRDTAQPLVVNAGAET